MARARAALSLSECLAAKLLLREMHKKRKPQGGLRI